jgi:hypothetical protein
MAETITTVLQATLVLTDDTVLTVTDDQGIARSVTIATNNTSTYWRPFVAYDTSPTTPSTDAA